MSEPPLWPAINPRVSGEADLVIRNGSIVTSEQTVRADVAIKDGRISALGIGLPTGRSEFDAIGLHVLPGLVDSHVHMRDPGLTEKGGFEDGTRAAAVGGVTTVFDMPTTVPAVVDGPTFVDKRALLAPKAHVDFGLYGLLGTDNTDQFATLAAEGCLGLKLFMGRSVGRFDFLDDSTILAGLEAAHAVGLLVGVHAENDHLILHQSDRLRRLGRTDAAAHSEARSDLAEAEAVNRILTYALALSIPIHLHHISSRASLRRIADLRQQGCHVSVEAIVGHLMLDTDDYDRFGNLINLNPPIRDASDVEALWTAIRLGEIDTIATDHAPHTTDEQSVTDVWHAIGGFTGVQTMLPVLLSQVAAGRFSLPDVVRLCSFAPARRWRIPGKGSLQPGFDADLVIVDMAATSVIRADALQDQHKVTPFDGFEATGVVRRTYLRGELIAADGAPVGPPGGQFVRPDRNATLSSEGN